MRERPEVFQKYDIRGKAPEEVDSELVFELGKALGDYWESGDILVGRDIRESSSTFYHAMISGLLSQGCNVTSLGLSSTDMLAYLTKNDFDAGVQITASHMPPEYGGFKPINSEGRILSNNEMAQIKRIYMKEEVSEEEYGEIKDYTEGKEKYREALISRYRELFGNDLSGLKIVVDCSNSVGGLVAPDALRELGAEVETLNSEFDPEFSSHSPKPSEVSSEMLQKKVENTEADLGVIFDGDADRVMFVDENGQFINGNAPLALISEIYLDDENSIVASINTSDKVDEIIDEFGGKIEQTRVGAVFTALKCIKEDITFGGQPNGHLMDSKFVPYDSGPLFSLIFAGIIKKKGKKTSDIIEELKKNDRLKITLDTEDKYFKMKSLTKKGKKENKILHEKFDSLKLDFNDFTALLRPSGSEDVIRVILEGEEIDSDDVSEVKKFIADLE